MYPPRRSIDSPDRIASPSNQYHGNNYPSNNNNRRDMQPPYHDGPMHHQQHPGNMRHMQQLPPQRYLPQNPNAYGSDIDPGMNGDGWQGQGQPGGGRGGGGHHMGGGRRGMHNHQQNRMPNQHHAPPHRMMPPNFRQPQQQPPQNPFMMVGMPEMMDMNVMRMEGMNINGGPPVPVIPQPNGMYSDMPPQPQWGQPQPFVQEEIYDHGPPFGGPPQHNGMHNGPPFGNSNRGGYNRGMNQNNRQGGGYRPPQNNYQVPVPMPHQMPPQQHQGQNFYAPQQPFAQPFPSGQPMTPMDQMGGNGSGGGGGGPQGGQGFAISTSTMDDYTMWQGETDEEAKKKKVLRDKGLTAWGDAETSNNKPIRRWLVPEGTEEDLETAMTRCPQNQKKKTAQEESLRRRLNSENPAIVQQAQQQIEEERNAMLNVGKRPIVACGWGDLPAELAEKHDYDQKGWDSASSLNNGSRSQDDRDPSGMIGAWNNSSQSSSGERRNPFFAQHMQQQHHVDGNQGAMGFMGPSGGNSNVGGGWPMEPQANMVRDIDSNMGPMVPVGEPHDENRMKIAENLRYAVEKGHLDINLLSLTHIPPNVLDLLTIILAKIPILDQNNDNLEAILSTRPDHISSSEDTKTWMNNDQQVEYDKLVINVVTARIEVTDLSRKINRALAEAGLGPSRDQSGPMPVSGGVGPSTSGHSQAIGGGNSQQNRSDTFDNGPPDHCDYYDYSFLG